MKTFIIYYVIEVPDEVAENDVIAEVRLASRGLEDNLDCNVVNLAVEEKR